MITHSKPIAVILLIDMLALLAYNFSGMCVTGRQHLTRTSPVRQGKQLHFSILAQLHKQHKASSRNWQKQDSIEL